MQSEKLAQDLESAQHRIRARVLLVESPMLYPWATMPLQDRLCLRQSPPSLA